MSISTAMVSRNVMCFGRLVQPILTRIAKGCLDDDFASYKHIE